MRTKRRVGRWAGIAAAALAVFAFVPPLLGRDVLVVASPLEGSVACVVGRPTNFYVRYTDYGNRTWIRLSRPVEAVALDSPDLKVTEVKHSVPPQWGLMRENALLLVEVVALRPGLLAAGSMTLTTRAGSRQVPVQLVFDAVEASPQTLTYDMSMNAGTDWLTSRGFLRKSLAIRRPHPLAVEVDLSSLPAYVEVVEAEQQVSDMQETQLVQFEMRLRGRPPAGGRGQFVWRPWVTVRSEDGVTERVPGEGHTFRWEWVPP
ncbi:MAG: hypothetical protein RDU89_10700 [bacterium]|nr:hypothetical protein [bacterium]